MKFYKVTNDLGYKGFSGYDDEMFQSIESALKSAKNDLFEFIKSTLLSIELTDDMVYKYIERKVPIFCVTMYDTDSYIFKDYDKAKLQEISMHINALGYKDIIYAVWYEKLYYTWEEQLVDAFQMMHFMLAGDCRCYLDFENRAINGSKFKIGDKVKYFNITYKNTSKGIIEEIPGTLQSHESEEGSWWTNVYKIRDEDGELYGIYESAITKI